MTHPSKKRFFMRGARGPSRLGGETLVLFLILPIPGCVRSVKILSLSGFIYVVCKSYIRAEDVEPNTFRNLSKVTYDQIGI